MAEPALDHPAGLGRPAGRVISAIGASWANRFLNIALNLMLTPLLFGGLGAAELGLWVTMQSAIGLLALLDLGLTSTLPRRFAFLRGATDIRTRHVEDAGAIALVQNLLVTGNRLYLIRMAATVLAGAALGVFALAHLDLDPQLAEKAQIAWAVIVIGQALQLWGAAWTASLSGFGLVAWQIGISSTVTSLGLLAQIGVVSAGFGIIALACVTAPLPVITRQVSIWTMRWLHPEIDPRHGRWDAAVARSMVRPSLAAWVTGLGAFATLRLDNYFIAAFVGLEEIGPYFAAMQIYNSVHILAIAVVGGATPLLSQIWKRGGPGSFVATATKVIAAAMMIAATGAAALVALGDRLFEVWIGPNGSPGDVVIALIALRIVLDTLQASCMGAARSTEFEVFARLSLTAAALNVALCFVLTPHFGLVGIVVSNLLAQGVTLHSIGVARAIGRIQPGSSSGVMRVLLVALAVGVGGYFAAIVVLKSGLFGGGALTVAAALAAVAIVLATGLWLLALDRMDRRSVVQALASIVRRRKTVPVDNGH
jgi:O-antigen/teichoic acid export membrane protein